MSDSYWLWVCTLSVKTCEILPTCGRKAYQHRVGHNEVVSHFSEIAWIKVITPYFILLFNACVAVGSCIESKTIPAHPHEQGIQTLELKPELSKGEQRWAWRHNCRHPTRSMPSSILLYSNPLSVVVLAVLSQTGLSSECQCGWINEVCHNQLFDNTVQLQNWFKTSYLVNPMLWSYNTGCLSLKISAWSARKAKTTWNLWRKNIGYLFYVI